MKQVSVEWVDKKIAEFEQKNPPVKVAKKAVNIEVICALINKALPILIFANGLLWWKPKWQKIIQQLIDVAGKICP